MGARTLWFGNPVISTTGTQYNPVQGKPEGSALTTEGFAQIPIATNGKAYNFRVNLPSAPGSGITRTFTLRVNGADTALVVAISGTSQTQNSDTTNQVTLNDGDLVSIKHVVTGGTAAAATTPTFTLVFEGDGNSFSIGASGGSSPTPTSDAFAPLIGSKIPGSWSVASGFTTLNRMAVAGVITAFRARVNQSGASFNSGTPDSAHKIRKNGSIESSANVSGSNMGYACNAATTGLTISVAVGDTLEYLWDAGGYFSNGTRSVWAWAIAFEPANVNEFPIMGIPTGVGTATNYAAFDVAGFQSTTEIQYPVSELDILSGICVLGATPAAGKQWDFRVRKNAVNGNGLMTLTNGETTESYTATDSFIDDDLLSYALIPTNTPANINTAHGLVGKFPNSLVPISVDKISVVESLSSVAKSAVETVESFLGINKAATTQVENAAKAAATKAANFESLISLAKTQMFILESLYGVSSAKATLLESLAKLQDNSIINVENRQALALSKTANIENLTLLAVSRIERIESLLKLAATRVINLESFKGLTASANPRLESLLGFSDSNVTAIESIARASKATALRIESLLSLAKTTEADFESLLTRIASAAVDLESLKGILGFNHLASTESLLGYAKNVDINIESISLAALVIDAVIHIESLAKSAVTKPVNLESLVRLAFSKTLLIESLKTIADTLAISLETLAKLAASKATSYESLIAIVNNSVLSTESLVGIKKLTVLKLESINGLLEAFDINSESLASVELASETNAESLARVEVLTTTSLETLADVARLTEVSFESLVSLLKNSAIPIESMEATRPDIIVTDNDETIVIGFEDSDIIVVKDTSGIRIVNG